MLSVHFQFLVLRFYFSSVSVAFPMTKKNPKGLKNIFAFKRGNNFNLLRSVCICITLHHKHLHLKWFKSVAFMFLWASCWPAQPQLLSLPMSWVMCHLCETLIISPLPPSWLCVCVCAEDAAGLSVHVSAPVLIFYLFILPADLSSHRVETNVIDWIQTLNWALSLKLSHGRICVCVLDLSGCTVYLVVKGALSRTHH